MKPTDRARLTTALRTHVVGIAADLRSQMRGLSAASGEACQRARRVYADEQVAEDFDVWTDLLSRRAAVLWVLKSVYVRVLEDRGLLAPGRLLDPEAQQLFERLAPNLGETAFLRWMYRDLASPNGGLPELFSPQPAEVALPSDDLSRALIDFWRHRDPDSGAHWSFAEERFEGELMGDLYQELDPVVKDRFALCQTPDFVREFILDRTLTPAMETFGKDNVRLLDPACGSGHFLIDGLKRIAAATAEQHPEWTRGQIVTHALDRVVGMDLNDYACALARARLIMTAADLAGVATLAGAAQFHPHVYWADGLEQVERDEARPAVQLGFLGAPDEKTRATLTRSDVRAALKKVFSRKFHAVVANPPYIVESDEARKEYHREKVGRGPRYVSAHRQYSLASPFTERCFQLAEKDGFVGLITSNNFMKREFGKPLIEKVLAGMDLTLVVDTSQAYIPFHGTPTALLFGRNRLPVGDVVRTVMGRRGEVGTPADPASGHVWVSIADGWAQVGFENEYVSVAELPRKTLAKYPWSLGGGGISDLKVMVESCAARTLSDLSTDIGRTTVCGEDGIFIVARAVAKRLGIADIVRPLAIGEVVRDWAIRPEQDVLYPYLELGGHAIAPEHAAVRAYFWRYRTLLRARSVFGKSPEERGGTWYEHLEHYAHRLRIPLSITFAFVATHNHFVLDRGGKVFKQSAPVIKLPPGATEDDHLALLGLLNSSVACFWMKQVFHPKTHASQRHHPDPARGVYEYTATGLLPFPMPEFGDLRASVVELSRRLDDLAGRRRDLLSSGFVGMAIGACTNASDLRAQLEGRWRESDVLREQMVALQEELDWTSYVAYGLAGRDTLSPTDRVSDLTCPRGSRPFERLNGRASTVRGGGRALTLAEGEVPAVGALPDWAEGLWQRREDAVRASADLRLIETPVFKRAWRDTEQNVAEPEHRRRTDEGALADWLVDHAESWAAGRDSMWTLGQMVAALQDDRPVLVVAEALTGRPDFSLDALILDALSADSVPHHAAHVYTASGLTKRAAWEDTWALQRREDAGETVGTIPVPPEYSQGSRGKSTDFLRTEYWQLRGKLDVPKERFIAFTEVPGRTGADTLYGWAGWTPLQRFKALLAIDEDLEDAGVPLADRAGVLDSAWRLLPDIAREDPAAAARLKAELPVSISREGPSRELMEEWRRKYPPPNTRAARTKRAPKADSSDDDSDEGAP